MLHTGFKHPVDDAQRNFRALLEALSRPLQPRALPMLPPALPGLAAGTVALLYTLADQDVAVWLPDLPADTLATLRFHTGMTLAASPLAADFIVIPTGRALPALDALPAGEAEYPDRAATLIIETGAFHQCDVEASGPGIAAPLRFGAQGLPKDFWRQWQVNHARYPLGVDALLVAGGVIAGLPRSVSVKEG